MSPTPAAKLSTTGTVDLPDPVVTKAASGYQNFADHPLFADAGPSPDDINQGQVGDCYFLSVLASVAKVDPALIERTVTSLGDGTYAVKFSHNGGAVTVRVDADLPTNGYGGLAYANFGQQGSIWVAIVEKAYAFFRKGAGTYASLDTGWMDESYTALGVSSRNTYSASSGAALLGLIDGQLSAGKSVTFAIGTPPANSGLVGSHAYEVDSVVRDASGAITGLVLRNPWGIDGYACHDGKNDGYVTLTPKQAFDGFIGFTSAAV